MTELNIPLSAIEGANLLNSEHAENQLFRLSPISFAIVERRTDLIIFAFASTSLAETLEDLGDPKIHDVYFIKHTEIASSHPWPEKSIHIQLIDTRFLVLDTNDHIRIQELYIPKGQKGVSFMSPHKAWGATPMKHFDQILLTDGLISVIESIAAEGQQLQLVHVLWLDLKLTVDPKELGARIDITGEFMEFSVSRHKGFFLFDMIDENCASY